MIINGKEISNKRNLQLKKQIDEITENRKPQLSIILVGHDKASEVYVKNKIKKASEVGILSSLYKFDSDVKQSEVEKLLKKLNSDHTVDGIIIQLPLPEHLQTSKLLDMVVVDKDVDGFSYKHQGLLFQGRPSMLSATPLGILTILEEHNIDVSGKHALVIGSSLIVGRPIAQSLILKNATVTVANKQTKNLKALTKLADIIISAAGVPFLVKKEMVKKGTVIIDVGINFVNGKTIGDCDFDNLKAKASYITPVPGGVGPMTITSLLENTYKAYLKNIKKEKE